MPQNSKEKTPTKEIAGDITSEISQNCEGKEWKDIGKRRNNHQLIDITNQRFGKLLALERKFIDNQFLWRCKCDCGNYVYANVSQLKQTRKSCGCSSRPDIINKRFGKLTVVRETNRKHKYKQRIFECLCDCGNTTYFTRGQLNSGHINTCGCSKCPNLVGKKFNKLFAIKEGKHNKRGKRQWICKCDCGRECLIESWNLQNGHTKSCGCDKRRKRSKFKKYQSAKNALFSSYKKSARKRNLSFKLSKRNFLKMTQCKCHYCNREPSNLRKCTSNNGDYIYNGIDRIDSSIGYIKNNCVPCCSDCNTMKLNLQLDKFLLMVKKIYEFNNLERIKY